MHNLLFGIQIGLTVLLIAFAVGLVLASVHYLRLTKVERSRYGATRRVSYFNCLAGFFIAGIIEALVLPSRLWRRLIHSRSTVALANIAEGTHAGGITKLSDAAQALRHALVKFGTDINHVAVAGAADVPWGVCTDEAAGAEENVNVIPLACAMGTIRVVNDATGAIAAGDQLVPAASGKVKKIAAGAGNYYVVGIAVQTAAADNEVFEAIPIGSWKTQ